MFKHHTLVIPTYNRPGLLKRLVRYYERQAGRPNLLVLDSSRPEVVAQNAAMLASYGDAARHAAFPADTSMAVKLARGLAEVQTQYVSFCADDDLVFPEGLREAMAFLDAHPAYVSAHGRYLNFLVRGDTIVDIWLEYGGPGNEAQHAGARIFRLFQRYESLFYGLFRTHDLQQIFAGVATLPTLHYQELFQSVASLIKGKVRRFSRIYAARQSGEPAEPTREKWQTYYWFADNPSEMIEHYLAYRAELWKFYQAQEPSRELDRRAFYRILDLSHAMYFAGECPPAYFHSVLQAYWPGDHFVELRDRRLLSRTQAWLRRFPRVTRRLRRARRSLRFLIGARHRPVRTLNEEARQLGITWKCRIPLRDRPLASQADFRSSYFELCSYLGQL